MKKSYHSKAVPVDDASTTVRIGVSAFAGDPVATVSIPALPDLFLARQVHQFDAAPPVAGAAKDPV